MRSFIKKSFDFKRFFVGEGPVNAPYELSQRRVYILPTKQGLTFAILLLVMLVGSINYSNSLGYFLTFLLSSLFVVSIFHTYNNLLKLKVDTAIIKPVFANQQAHILIPLQNLQTTRFSVQAFFDRNNVTISDLEPNSFTTITVSHTFKQRGLNLLPRMTLQTTFPLGLFRAWAFVQLDQSVLVFPSPSNHQSLPSNLNGLMDGKESNQAGNDDFRNLRTFHEGDPLQHVHWKSYARHQKMLTKEFSGLESEQLWLNWSDTVQAGIESKLSQLARWIILADEAGLSYGLRLPEIEVKPGQGRHHFEACLKQLALF